MAVIKINQTRNVVWIRILGRFALNFGNVGTDPSLREEVLRAKQGDKDAFAIIFHKLEERLLAFCHQACYGHHEFEDVATEVWVEIDRKLPNYEGATAQEIFRLAVTIARQRSIDFYRRRRRQPGQFPMDDDEKTYDPASSGIDSLDRLILLEESEAIRKCI